MANLLHAPRFADLIRLITPNPASDTTVVPPTPAAVAGVITAALDDPDELLALVPGGRLDAAAGGYLTPAR